MAVPGSTLDLHVESCDLHIQENAKAHRTNLFDVIQWYNEEHCPALFRRGQVFDMSVKFNKSIRSSIYKHWFQFLFGDDCDGVRDSVEISNQSLSQNGFFTVKSVRKYNTSLKIKVYISPKAMVGEWQVAVMSALRVNNEAYSIYNYPKTIYVLFNCWSKDDDVYIPDKKKAKEYVFNEKGVLLRGNVNQVNMQPWHYDQFSFNSLTAAVRILQGALAAVDRGDVVKMARAISSRVNSNSGEGILEGCWCPPYTDGTNPGTWTGSKLIIKEFLQSGGPVKYGQCWVFSAVTVTICRALGIPCRSITNYRSAHDTNGSITIDIYYNDKGERIDDTGNTYDGSYDSIWNFHVWNEIWAVRADLDSGFGEWQVIDSTPQEISSGLYQCGPFPVRAALYGKVDQKYDGPFIYSEINGDVVHWLLKGSKRVFIRMDKSDVGRLIVTKAPDRLHDYKDITRNYKFKEGNPLERASVLEAIRYVGHSGNDEVYSSPVQDVVFELKIKFGLVGQDIVVQQLLQNNSREKRSINTVTTLSAMLYTGVTTNKIRNVERKHELAPGGRKDSQMVLKEEHYYDRLLEGCTLIIFVFNIVTETDQVLLERRVFELNKPKLKIETTDTARVKLPLKVTLTFKNCLNRPISNVECALGGKGIEDVSEVISSPVVPHDLFKHSFVINPTMAGEINLVATAIGDQKIDLSAAKVIRVRQ